MSATGYKDYFQILGVSRNADQNQIKDAFRKLARQCHPDVNQGDKSSEEKFKEISEAYEVLSDPGKRRKYEQFGQYWNQSQGMGAGYEVDFGRYGNFDDFVNDLLGRFRSGNEFSRESGFPPNSYAIPRTLNASTNLKITFREAFQGTERTFSINEERVMIRIPKGVKSGAKLRVKGKGNIQPGTGRRGDLYINLTVEDHPIWKFDGDHLSSQMPVSIDELLLGAEITIITPDGEAKVTIPPGTTPGKILRLKGKGWPINNGRSDLLLILKMCIPDKFSSKELYLLKELRKLRLNDPREDWMNSARL